MARVNVCWLWIHSRSSAEACAPRHTQTQGKGAHTDRQTHLTTVFPGRLSGSSVNEFHDALQLRIYFVAGPRHAERVLRHFEPASTDTTRCCVHMR